MKNKNYHVLGIFGILSAFLLTFADALGSILRSNFSPISQAISELVEAGAPNKLLLDSLLIGFHGFAIIFAYGLHKTINNGKGKKTGPLLLGGAGFIGIILTLFFPCDPGCVFETTRGILHILLAIPMGFMVLFSILAFSKRFKNDNYWKKYSKYSQITFILGLILGLSSVFFAKTSIGGILERLISLSYQQWYIVIGFKMLTKNK